LLVAVGEEITSEGITSVGNSILSKRKREERRRIYNRENRERGKRKIGNGGILGVEKKNNNNKNILKNRIVK
jgi:hypothetical protein